MRLITKLIMGWAIILTCVVVATLETLYAKAKQIR